MTTNITWSLCPQVLQFETVLYSHGSAERARQALLQHVLVFGFGNSDRWLRVSMPA